MGDFGVDPTPSEVNPLVHRLGPQCAEPGRLIETARADEGEFIDWDSVTLVPLDHPMRGPPQWMAGQDAKSVSTYAQDFLGSIGPRASSCKPAPRHPFIADYNKTETSSHTTYRQSFRQEKRAPKPATMRIPPNGFSELHLPWSGGVPSSVYSSSFGANPRDVYAQA